MTDFLKEEEKQELLKWKKALRFCFLLPFKIFLILSLQIRKYFKIFSVISVALLSISFMVMAYKDFQVEKCKKRNEEITQRRHKEATKKYLECQANCVASTSKVCKQLCRWEDNRSFCIQCQDNEMTCLDSCKLHYGPQGEFDPFFGQTYCGEKSFFNLFD